MDLGIAPTYDSSSLALLRSVDLSETLPSSFHRDLISSKTLSNVSKNLSVCLHCDEATIEIMSSLMM
ncbi:hypothetical protein OGATHE_003381 [Ogataea polymorpha]|uniref:Uncharacterized protein n=1 Tax=Ogataea polymorpha TaxID=460523 RepID=A0A9P8T479_9ASCO|nr:hypothetical protein OGATHE_003381 [Ogataea polymorpha]